MKAIKKLLSIVMVLTLVLSLGASALAVDIVVDDANATGSTYYYFQLMTVGNEGTKAQDGSPLFQYKINDKYRTAIKAGLKAGGVMDAENENQLDGATIDAADDEALVEYVSRLVDVRKFADAIYAQVGTTDAEHSQTAATPDATGAAKTTWNGAPDGYYLIVESTTGGVVSLVMLDTLTNKVENMATVTTKEDKPTSQKKVIDTNDSTGETSPWQDSADHDIGDTISYQLRAKVPSADTYGAYETYFLQFQDRMSKGLTFGKTTAMYWTETEGGEHHNITFEVAQPGIPSDSPHQDGSYITWTNNDIKGAGVPAGAYVYIEYTARLNESAVIGVDGNPNDSRIEFSNNPYNTGDGGSHGTTPWDVNIVFTYEFDADKVDGAGDPLEGAAFTLYKKVATGGSALEGHEGNWTAVKEHKVVAGQTKFEFAGLDDGEYVLVETTVPDGFNKADDIVFTVTADHEVLADSPALKGFEATGDVKVKEGGESSTAVTGKYEFDVVNLTGLELPSTGGIGTTIFYVIGAVLVAAAVVLLVTKKRVNGAEK